VLGVGAARGRTFTEIDGRPSASAPVIVSWALFERRFGGDADAVGRRIVLNGTPVTLIGVLPPEFRLQFPADAGIPDELQVFQPFPTDLARGHRLVRYYRVVGRLADGATMREAAHEIEAIGTTLARRFPGYTTANHSFYVVPLVSDSTRVVRPMLWALLGGVVVVLVAACANVAGLLLARAAARRREVATRVALGADRARLTRQFLIEGLLITGVGTLAGLGTGFVALRAIVVLRPPALDRLQHATIDTPVLVVIAAVACLWGLFFALAPLTEFARLDVAAGLQNLSPAPGRLRNRVRSTLVVAQVALGTVLIVTAGLLVRTMDALQHVDLGFDPSVRALTFRLALPAARYPHSADVNAFSRELETRLRALPGVQHVGAINHLPFDAGNSASKYFTENSDRDLALARAADARYVSPGILPSLGIRLVEGRWFTEDDDTDRQPVVVVDERLAARAWPGQHAVGQRLHLPLLIEREVRTDWTTVIGVVRHVRHRTPDAEVQEQVYLSSRQNLPDPMAYIVRTGADPASLTAEMRDVVAGLDGLLPAYDIRPLETYVASVMSARSFTTVLIASFALLALALASVGLAGVVSHSVASRQREFGIRLAVGATPAHVRSKVLAEAFLLVGSGVGLGILGAGVAANGMRSLFFGVGLSDWLSYGTAIALLGLTGAGASWWPARRAMRVNPVEALRSE
jgi:predicted permease